MDILFASEYFPPHAPGGAEWSVYALAEALGKSGHSLRIVTPDSIPAMGEEKRRLDQDILSAGRVRVIRFPMDFGRKKGEAARGVFPSYRFGNPWFHRRFARALRAELMENNADILHAQGYDSLVPVVLAAGAAGAALPRVATIRDYRTLCPISICLHDEDYAPRECSYGDFRRCSLCYLRQYGYALKPLKRIKHDLRRFLEWRNHASAAKALLSMDGTIFVSKKIMDIYGRSGLNRRRDVVIPNLPRELGAAKDPGELIRRLGIEGRRVLLFVGRYSLGKGAGILSRAMEIVGAREPDAVCVVAGRREASLCAGNMVFAGHLEPSELASLYGLAHVVLLPSRWQEPLSRVLIESMQARVPVVATDSGGNGEVIRDGRNGRLVPRNNPPAFAEAILELLHMEEGRFEAMRRAAGCALGELFDPADILRRVESFYDEAVRRRRSGI